MLTDHPSSKGKNSFDMGELRTGDYTRSDAGARLRQDIEGAPDNYRLRYGVGEGEGIREVPRHHHNFEQFRRPLGDGYSIAKDIYIPAGWVGYFPESTYYGPQRTAACEMITLQFGGPSGLGFMTIQQRRRGYDELRAKGGDFINGLYTWSAESGERHNMDAYEAVWQHIFGKPVEYPPSRYDKFILMNPEACSWIDDPDRDGVAHKRLGTFSEREIRVGFTALEPGASFAFGTQPSNEVMHLESGSVAHEHDKYEVHTIFSSATSDEAVVLTAIEPSVLFYIKLPTFYISGRP